LHFKSIYYIAHIWTPSSRKTNKSVNVDLTKEGQSKSSDIQRKVTLILS